MTPTAFRQAVALILVVSASAQIAGTGAISGIVLNATTGQPILKALVRLELGGPKNASAAAMTDSGGAFFFQNLPAGQYRLFAGKEGFQGLAYGTQGNSQAGTFITLAAAETRNDLNFRLPPTSLVSGTVLDSDGDPIVNAQVLLLRPMYQRGRLELMPTFNATTDDRGAYRISSIQPDRYYLKVDPQRQMQFAGMAMPNSEPVAVPEFFPGTVDLNRATRLDLRDGKEARGIDFRLNRFAPGIVLARAVLPSGMPEELPVQFELSSASDPRGGTRSISTSVFQNSVLRAEAPPGDHIASINFNFNGANYYAASRVTIQPGREEEITLTPRPLLDIPCSMKVEGLDSEKYRQFRLTLTPPQQFNGSRPQTEWKAGGECKFTGVRPGIWDIGIFPLTPPLYIKAMTFGGKDVLNEEMELRDQSSDVLTVVVSTAAAELTGEVEKTEGGQIQPAIVLFAPAVHQFSTIQFYRTAYTGPDGKFRFGGLAPGNYRVFAFEKLEFNAWQDAEFLKPYAASATPVKLSEGQKAAIQVRRIPAEKQESKP